MKEVLNFINGEFVATGNTFPKHSPLNNAVIAQVHGHCLAGGSELATCCDLVYVAEDANIGYPPVRLMSPPDMQFHPWLMGMAHRIKYLDEALRRIERFGNSWQATPGEIVRHYIDTMMG